MTDHQAEVERLLAEYRRSREQLSTVHRKLAAISACTSSQDGLVTATVGQHGVLTGLELTEQTYRRYEPHELASLIVRLAAEAAADASKQAQEVLEPVLPRSVDPAAVLAGTADLRPAEIAPPIVGSDVTDDADESLDERSWLEQARHGRLG